MLTWARRKTRISTPVAITTDAEQQEVEVVTFSQLEQNLDMLDGCQTTLLWFWDPRKKRVQAVLFIPY